MTLGRAGSELELGSEGGGLRGYRALPTSGRGRGVLVLHEAFGLVEQIRDVCDRLARAGFVALAPDLFRGRCATDAAEAGRLIGELDAARLGGDLQAAVRELLSCEATEGSRVGAVGFCMGGYVALFAACRDRRIGAAVDFYGALPEANEVRLDPSALDAAVLGIFAERDEFVSAERMNALRQQLEAAGARVTWKVELGVGHGFMNEARPEVYDARAAAEGWDAMLSFLQAELT
jgi:carboxymethylenebutenolidase